MVGSGASEAVPLPPEGLKISFKIFMNLNKFVVYYYSSRTSAQPIFSLKAGLSVAQLSPSLFDIFQHCLLSLCPIDRQMDKNNFLLISPDFNDYCRLDLFLTKQQIFPLFFKNYNIDSLRNVCDFRDSNF